jgi:hypothetical protein
MMGMVYPFQFAAELKFDEVRLRVCFDVQMDDLTGGIRGLI